MWSLVLLSNPENHVDVTTSQIFIGIGTFYKVIDFRFIFYFEINARILSSVTFYIWKNS